MRTAAEEWKVAGDLGGTGRFSLEAGQVVQDSG